MCLELYLKARIAKSLLFSVVEHSENSEVFGQSKPDSEEWHTFGFASESEDQDVSFHEISQKRSIHAWNSLRESILAAVTECHEMPDGQMCTCCNAVFAMFRCIQCGPYMYFCDSCLPKSHLYTNVFHTPERWEVLHLCSMWFIAC